MTRAVWNGAVIAESDDVEIVDGYTYFPIDTVDQGHLQPSDRHTTCAWKGTASYYDVVVDGKVNQGAAWYYPQPSQKAAPLVGGRVGFWRGVTIEHGSDGGDDAGERHGLLGRLTGRRR